MSLHENYIYPEELRVKNHTNETFYQDLKQVVSKLHVVMEDSSSLEMMFFNSPVDLNIELSKDSKLTIYNVYLKDESVKININIDILGENSNVEVINVYLTRQNNNLESNIFINHKALYTNSELETYAIGKDKAHMVLNNNAYIYNGMHQSKAKQATKGLTLSKDAKITAQPNLFIDEYDVEASHSAAIGSVNKEDLFYLMSRGLTVKEAEEMIVLGFIQPVLANIQNEKLKEEINNEFIKVLK